MSHNQEPPRIITPQPAIDMESATAYPRLMTPDTVRLYMELGFDATFSAILSRYLQDLHLVGQKDADRSYLTVSAHQEGDTEEPVWHREMVVSAPQRDEYRQTLQDGYEAIDDGLRYPNFDPERTLDKLAVDWIFFELSADAAAESCYMQHKYDRYIPGFNGQNRNWRSDLKISDEYLRKQTEVEPSRAAANADHESLRAGIGMVLLHDSILRTDLFEGAPAARWLISYLQMNHPAKTENKYFSVHSTADVILRLSGVTPRDTRRELEEYLAALDGQLEE